MSKNKLFDVVNVIDLEATAWEPKESKPPDEKSEIIEIGIATLCLKTLEIIENESIIVRPQKSKISNFCTELTTITQEMVDKGISLEEAMKILKTKYKIHKRALAGWGDYDKKMLIQDCMDKGMKFPGEGRSYTNIKNLLAISYGWNKEIGLDRAVKRFGLSFGNLRQHRGFADALMTAKIFALHIKNTRKNIEPESIMDETI